MPSKKKVLFVITKSNWGGAQRYVYDLATSLPKEHFEPVVALGGHGVLKEKLGAAQVPTITIRGMQRNISFFKELVSFFRLLYLLGWKVRPDVVHLNSSKAAGLGALAARLTFRKRIIFTAHGWPFKEDRSALMRGVIYILSWITAVLSHVVIVVSKRDEQLGVRMWGCAHKMHYVPLGIQPPTFIARASAAAALSLTSTGPRIVTIAELMPNKGLRYGIEAIAEMNKHGLAASYFIISDGPEREWLETFAKQLRIADQIHFLGHVPNAAQYLKAFDIFLLPSLKEGAPYVLLEAAYAELPIVTTEAVDADFTDFFSGMTRVATKDSVALARALETSLANTQHTSTHDALPFAFAPFIEKTTRLYTAD